MADIKGLELLAIDGMQATAFKPPVNDKMSWLHGESPNLQ